MQEKGTEQSMLLLSTLCFLEELISFLNNVFLELGFKSIDCTEMSWIESILYFSGYPKEETIEALINIADFIEHPIAEPVLKKLWNWCLEEEKPKLIRDGRMEEISESETSFPYREAILYSIQFGQVMSSNWIRYIYESMTSYMSKNPRLENQRREHTCLSTRSSLKINKFERC